MSKRAPKKKNKKKKVLTYGDCKITIGGVEIKPSDMHSLHYTIEEPNTDFIPGVMEEIKKL